MDLHRMSFRPTSPTRPMTPDCPRNKHHSRLGVWQKLQHFFGRDGSVSYIDSADDDVLPKSDQQKSAKRSGCSNARPVGVGLPRQATFKRQNSEKRERLCLIEPLPHERRAVSMSRPTSTALAKFRSNSVPAASLPMRCSAPAIGNTLAINDSSRYSFDAPDITEENYNDSISPPEYNDLRPPRPPSVTSSTDSYEDQMDFFEDRTQLDRELDTKWILNLSMHFRDKSDREKFFVTYAETPTRWRRVTVSCDYRNAEPGSLEMDLKELQLQRDKSMQIYEAIRESLLEIKFYDTVTNLKLETSDGRLHVHVTEDANEIIPYPPVTSLLHILQDEEHAPMQIRESELSFEAHLSGFVYKVKYRGRPYIKKEIPGPDTVDEFLYEVNALYSLQDSPYVIDLEAIVTDDSGSIIKGLLINYAERGAVVDLLYDHKGDIAWGHREKWARHTIQGLSDIHEEGYVQGDFTLSNIVVDKDYNARIIDINRRGCPVGWEPPEIAKKIASNQRISMYIGQKSDLYQLGMTLWALAMDDDEPERHDPPLSTQEFPAEVPSWYQDIVRNCLSLRPRDRSSATDLMKLFPPEDSSPSWISRSNHPTVRVRPEKRYIDPDAAVGLDDLEKFRDERHESDETRFSPQSSRENYSFTWPQSSNYDRECDSASSELERPRGRRRISDHDLMLRAQRQNEAFLPENSMFSNIPGEAGPVITISSDGTASHIIEMDDEPYAMETHHPIDENARTLSPALSPRLVGLPHFADRILLNGLSDTSEETPRNSSTQLVGYHTSGPDHEVYVSQSDSMPHELAGLGMHPNFSRHSLEQMQQHLDGRTVNENMSPTPHLQSMSSPFDDSSNHDVGFDDYIAFKDYSGLESAQIDKLADAEHEHAQFDQPEDVVSVPHELSMNLCEPATPIVIDLHPQGDVDDVETLEQLTEKHDLQVDADPSLPRTSTPKPQVAIEAEMTIGSEPYKNPKVPTADCKTLTTPVMEPGISQRDLHETVDSMQLELKPAAVEEPAQEKPHTSTPSPIATTSSDSSEQYTHDISISKTSELDAVSETKQDSPASELLWTEAGPQPRSGDEESSAYNKTEDTIR